MRKLFTVLLMIIPLCSAVSKELKPLYKLDDERILKNDKNAESKNYLVASDKGLFKIASNNSVVPLWEEGSVEQILRSEIPDENQKLKEIWYFRTSKGILYSEDLENFELRNEGLPFLTIKNFDGKEISFEKVVHQLKDLCVNPSNPLQIVTATKDRVYFSRDGGKVWKSVGSMSPNTSGVKAVAIAQMPLYSIDGTFSGTELVIFMSHPIFGFSYYQVDSKNPKWVDVTAAFEMRQ